MNKYWTIEGLTHGKTLGAVESFTGGLFASAIIAKQGASRIFKGAIVSYDNSIKEKLGIDTTHGVVNEETARAMALQGKAFLNVDICVAFTGNAGPDTLDGKPKGKVFIAINEQVYEKQFCGSRNSVRRKAVNFVIKKLKSEKHE